MAEGEKLLEAYVDIVARTPYKDDLGRAEQDVRRFSSTAAQQFGTVEKAAKGFTQALALGGVVGALALIGQSVNRIADALSRARREARDFGDAFNMIARETPIFGQFFQLGERFATWNIEPAQAEATEHAKTSQALLQQERSMVRLLDLELARTESAKRLRTIQHDLEDRLEKAETIQNRAARDRMINDAHRLANLRTVAVIEDAIARAQREAAAHALANEQRRLELATRARSLGAAREADAASIVQIQELGRGAVFAAGQLGPVPELERRRRAAEFEFSGARYSLGLMSGRLLRDLDERLKAGEITAEYRDQRRRAIADETGRALDALKRLRDAQIAAAERDARPEVRERMIAGRGLAPRIPAGLGEQFAGDRPLRRTEDILAQIERRLAAIQRQGGGLN